MPLTIQTSHHHQIGREDAPADPLLKAFIAMTGATAQLHRALDHTDPSFDPVPETLPLLEPGLPFTLLPTAIPIPWFRQDNMLDPHLPGEGFVLG